MENQEQQLTKKERREMKRLEKTERHGQEARQRLIKRAGLWILAALVIGGVVFGMIKLAGNSPTTNQPSGGEATPISASDQVRGNKDAKISLIEYSDFQCPACGAYYPMLKKLSEEFGAQMQFAYRNFPLKQIHDNAESAAYAVEAAGKQGKFWEMHDMIFENQSQWSSLRNTESIFEKYADSLKLDIQKFKEDMESGEIKAKVSADYDSGISAGVNSTPTFFLNGKQITNPKSYDEFKDLIDKTLSPDNPRT